MEPRSKEWIVVDSKDQLVKRKSRERKWKQKLLEDNYISPICTHIRKKFAPILQVTTHLKICMLWLFWNLRHFPIIMLSSIVISESFDIQNVLPLKNAIYVYSFTTELDNFDTTWLQQHYKEQKTHWNLPVYVTRIFVIPDNWLTGQSSILINSCFMPLWFMCYVL